MSYEFYKVIHLVSLILVTSTLGIAFFSETPKKWARILGMTASFLLFVAGMGLIARVGFSHGEGWPMWIKLKIAIWLVIAVGGPILAKRLTKYRGLAYAGLMALFTIAIVMVINRAPM